METESIKKQTWLNRNIDSFCLIWVFVVALCAIIFDNGLSNLFFLVCGSCGSFLSVYYAMKMSSKSEYNPTQLYTRLASTILWMGALSGLIFITDHQENVLNHPVHDCVSALFGGFIGLIIGGFVFFTGIKRKKV